MNSNSKAIERHCGVEKFLVQRADNVLKKLQELETFVRTSMLKNNPTAKIYGNNIRRPTVRV